MASLWLLALLSVHAEGAQLRQAPAPAASTSYTIVHSTESNPYQMFQSVANYHSFTTTTNDTNAKYMRLVTMPPGATSMESDWVSQKGVPSMFFSRHHLANSYGPMNKPDVLTKWMQSAEAPETDVVVILDPDSFITRDMSPVVGSVKPKRGVAAPAWFSFARSETTAFYKDFMQSIGATPQTEQLDLAAVPYLVHKDDMAELAPLWAEYTVKMKEHPKWKDSGRPLDTAWTAEMYAFVFAAAQLGIKFDINDDLQVRDTDFRGPEPRQKQWYTIHTGRAWFPHSYHKGRKWQATSYMPEFTTRGYEVWCKCNATGREEIPWPLPSGMDPVSRQTLTVLHDSFEKYGHYHLQGGSR